MKTKISNNGKYLFALLLGLVVILPSCKKNDSDTDVNANVMLVNSFEGSAAQDLYLNSTKVNSQAVAYGQSSGYISTTSGDKVVELKNTGSTSVNTASTANLEGGKYYTFFYSGSGSSSSSTKTEDDMTPPPSGKCKVRYVNLNSTGSSNVDFSLNGAKLGSALTFKSASSFSVLDPGAYTFKVMTAGTSTLLFDLPVTLQAGKIYTIWASGNTVLSSHIITHN
jgi:hypothetical protein